MLRENYSFFRATDGGFFKSIGTRSPQTAIDYCSHRPHSGTGRARAGAPEVWLCAMTNLTWIGALSPSWCRRPCDFERIWGCFRGLQNFVTFADAFTVPQYDQYLTADDTTSTTGHHSNSNLLGRIARLWSPGPSLSCATAWPVISSLLPFEVTCPEKSRIGRKEKQCLACAHLVELENKERGRNTNYLLK